MPRCPAPPAAAPTLVARLAQVGVLAGFAAALLLPPDAVATMYKCPGPGGRVEYSDKPCGGDPKAKPFVPRPLNTVSSESLTGRKAEPPPEKDVRPDWLKPMNPIEDCRRKGGEFDKEFRACKLPLKDAR